MEISGLPDILQCSPVFRLFVVYYEKNPLDYCMPTFYLILSTISTIWPELLLMVFFGSSDYSLN